MLVLAVLLCHGVMGASHQSSSYQEPPVVSHASEHSQPTAGGEVHGGESGSMERGLGGSYYAAALILLGISGLAAAMALGIILLVVARRAGAALATRWSVRPRLRPPPAPTGDYLRVFRL